MDRLGDLEPLDPVRVALALTIHGVTNLLRGDNRRILIAIILAPGRYLVVRVPVL